MHDCDCNGGGGGRDPHLCNNWLIESVNPSTEFCFIFRNSATFKSFEERVVGVKPRGSTDSTEENGSQRLHSPDKSQDSAPF